MDVSWYDALIEAYSLTNPNIGLLIASAITFGFGFWEYIYSFRLTHREGIGPFPIWMHTFCFAHDSSWAVILFLAASRHDWNWFLLVGSIALLVWTLFEVYNLVTAVRSRKERIENFSRYFGDDVTPRQAILSILTQIAAFYGLVDVVILFMGEGSFFQWAAITNMVMATGPATVWLRRRSREGNGMGIALVILGGTINTFLPIGMFVGALPQVFNRPWFYIAGVIFTAIAVANVVMVSRFPAKQQVAGQKHPIR